MDFNVIEAEVRRSNGMFLITMLRPLSEDADVKEHSVGATLAMAPFIMTRRAVFGAA